MTLIKPIKEATGATLRLCAMIVRNRWIFNDVAKEDLYCQAAVEAKEEHDALVKRIRELEEMEEHYNFLCEEVPKIYDEVTGGRLSKLNYPAQTVIRQYYDNVEKLIEERLEEDKQKP